MGVLDKKTLGWKAVTMASGMAAGLVVERLLALVWEKSLNQDAPRNQADRRTSWLTAVSWAAATGVAVGVARLVANRSAAAVWEAAIDETPPGVPDHEAA